MTARLAVRVALGLSILAALLAALALVRAAWDDDRDGAGVPPPAAERVAAMRQDVVAVSVLDAVVASAPRYVLAADEAGTLSGLVTGAVSAGQTVATVDGIPLTAPVDGEVVEWRLGAGDPVVPGMVVAELRFAGLGLVAGVPDSDAYRVHEGLVAGEGSVTGGPAGFACTPLIGVPAGDAEPAGTAVACAVDPGIRLFDGLPAQLALTTATAEDVIVVPVTAVLGSADSGVVWKVGDDGEPARVPVGLGVSDGSVIEITTGLEEGDVVLRNGPLLGGG